MTFNMHKVKDQQKIILNQVPRIIYTFERP